MNNQEIIQMNQNNISITNAVRLNFIIIKIKIVIIASENWT